MSLNIRERSQKLKAVTSSEVGSISNRPTPTPWDDDHFEAIYRQYDSWLNKQGSLDVGVTLALEYIAYYLGILPWNMADHTKCLQSLLIYMDYKGTSLFKTKSEQASVVGKEYKRPKSLKTVFQFPSEVRLLTAASHKFDVKDVETFLDKVELMRQEQDSEKRQTFINLACFMALNMYRVTKKEVQQIYVHMVIAANNSFKSCYKPSITFTIPPPSTAYVQNYQSEVYAYGPVSTALGAIMVQSWIDHSTNANIIGILKASCLLALSEVGLGAISWTVKAALKLKLEYGPYLELCCVNEIVTHQVDKVYDFVTKKDKGKTWPFCRLFEDSALINLSTKDNAELSILSAFIAMENFTMVTEMAQFKDFSTLADTYAPVAAAIIQQTIKSKPLSAFSEGAQAILALQKKFEGKSLRQLNRALKLPSSKTTQDDQEEHSEGERDSGSETEGGESDEEMSVPDLGSLVKKK